jgi:hypothetical protein
MKEKEIKTTAESNKIEEWTSLDPNAEEKLEKYLKQTKYSFVLSGLKIGFNTMTMEDGLLHMNNVLLAYPTQQDNGTVIHNFLVYKVVIFYGNTLIYPS